MTPQENERLKHTNHNLVAGVERTSLEMDFGMQFPALADVKTILPLRHIGLAVRTRIMSVAISGG